MGDLTVQAPQELFPDDLCHHLALRLVGSHTSREQMGALLGKLGTLLQKRLDPFPGLGAERNHCGKLHLFGIPGNDRQKRVLLHSINLVDYQNHRFPGLAQLLQQRLLLGAQVCNGFHHQKDGVHLGHRLPGDIHHVIAQLGPGLMKPGGIHKNKLSFAPVYNAADAVPGGLGFVRYNGHLFPHQPVGQGGFSHIGAACDGDHCGFACHSGSPFAKSNS